MKLLGILLLVFCSLSFDVLAEVDLILNDGSKIRGELISVSHGMVVVKTTNMGTVKFPKSKIVKINKKKPQKSEYEKEKAALLDSKESLQPHDIAMQNQAAMQYQMMQNQAMMAQIYALQTNPEFIQLMQDPQFLKDLQSGDMEVLMKNENFVKILNNPELKAMVEGYK